MGVLSKMEADGIVKSVQRGGLISPFGHKCINTDGTAYGSVTGCKTYAIKRYIADEYLVRAAAAQDSVHLFENTEVTNTAFLDGFWKISVTRTDKDTKSFLVFRSKIVLICDGSTSYMAQKLGIVPKGSQPEAVCSHAYIKGSSHKVCILLYSSLFAEWHVLESTTYDYDYSLL